MPGTKALSLFRLGYPSLLRTMGGLMSFVGIRPAFTPTGIAGLQLWLDASNAATLFQNSNGTTPATADNDPVGYWGDLSGHGWNETQATAAARPTLKLAIQNGLPAVLFDGVDDFLASTSFSAADPLDVYLACRWLDTSGINFVYGLNSGTDGVRIYGYAGGTDAATMSSKTGGGFFSLTFPTGWNQVTARYNGASSSFRANGTQTATGTTDSGTATGLEVASIGGGTFPANLYVGEMLVYTSLSAADQAAVEGYLKGKWGTP